MMEVPTSSHYPHTVTNSSPADDLRICVLTEPSSKVHISRIFHEAPNQSSQGLSCALCAKMYAATQRHYLYLLTSLHAKASRSGLPKSPSVVASALQPRILCTRRIPIAHNIERYDKIYWLPDLMGACLHSPAYDSCAKRAHWRCDKLTRRNC